MQERNSIIGDNYRWPHVIPYVLDDSLGTVFALDNVCMSHWFKCYEQVDKDTVGSFPLESLEQTVSHGWVGPGCAQAGCSALVLGLALTSFLGPRFLSCCCFGPADWFCFKSIWLRHETLLSRNKTRAPKIFLRNGREAYLTVYSLRGKFAFWQAMPFAMAHCWVPCCGPGTHHSCLYPFQCTWLWLCMEEVSGESGSLSSCRLPRGRLCPHDTMWGHLSGTW